MTGLKDALAYIAITCIVLIVILLLFAIWADWSSRYIWKSITTLAVIFVAAICFHPLIGYFIPKSMGDEAAASKK